LLAMLSLSCRGAPRRLDLRSHHIPATVRPGDDRVLIIDARGLAGATIELVLRQGLRVGLSYDPAAPQCPAPDRPQGDILRQVASEDAWLRMIHERRAVGEDAEITDPGEPPTLRIEGCRRGISWQASTSDRSEAERAFAVCQSLTPTR